ncbi:MAG: FG-GAP repeat protein, partial [Planctomycetaceae bacterium]
PDSAVVPVSPPATPPVVAGDVNKDGLPDVVVGNKKGTFLLTQTRKKVSAGEFEKARPKRQ